MKKIIILCILSMLLSCTNKGIDYYQMNNYEEFSMNFDFEWLPTLQKHFNQNNIFFQDKHTGNLFYDGSIREINIKNKKITINYNNKIIPAIIFINKDNPWGGNLYIFFENKELIELFEKSWIGMSEELGV